MAANKAPKPASTIGLRNMVIAPLTLDDETEVVYGALQAVAGAIEASVAPQNADPDIQHYDDIEGDVLYPDPELTFTTKFADLPLSIQEMILGNKLDSNGVLIRSAIDTPPYFAVGFASEKSNRKMRYVWLYKVRAKPITENYATKAGRTITRQTGDVEWTAIKRTHDGQYQAIADEGENGFTPQMGETFLASVYASDVSSAVRIGAMLYDVEAPVKSATPQVAHDAGDGYTAAIAWLPAGGSFEGETVYTATVTYTAKSGFIFDAGLVATDVIGAPLDAVVTRESATVVKVAVTYPATSS